MTYDITFSPIFYQVQDLIKNDDAVSLEKLFSDPRLQDELKSYHEDFMHETYPNHFKCLSFLMDKSREYNIHSLMYKCLTQNNHEWLQHFFDNLTEKIHYYEQKFVEEKDKQYIYDKLDIHSRLLNLSVHFPYEELLDTSDSIKKILFQSHHSKIVDTNQLISEIFKTQRTDKLYELDRLFDSYPVKKDISTVINYCITYDQLNFAEYFLKKHPTIFNNEQIKRFIGEISNTDNINALKFLNENILPLEKFNDNYKTILFNRGLLNNKFQLLEYLAQYKKFQFYPEDIELKKLFIIKRDAIWLQKNNTKHSVTTTLDCFKKIHSLFLENQWDISLLKDELKKFLLLSSTFNKVIFHEKMNNQLASNSKPSNKVKI